MNYTYLFTWVSLFTGFLLLILVIGTIKFSKSSDKISAALLFSLLSLYCFGYAFELQNYPLGITLRIIGIEYIGICFAPVLLFLIVMRMNGTDSGDAKNFLPYLLVIPFIIITIAWTDLIIPGLYQKVWINHSSLVPGYSTTPGLWWYVITIWNGLLLIVCLVILFRLLLKPGAIHRKQILLLIVGIIAPLFGIILNTYARTLIPVDFTPITLVITGLALYPAIISYNLFDIIPTAYATILRRLGSGIIVLDNDGRIRDINPAAEEIFQVPKKKVIGEKMKNLLPSGSGIFCLGNEIPEYRKEIIIAGEEKNEYYLLDQIPLDENQKILAGSVLMFTRITELKEKEEQLKMYTSIIEKRNLEIQSAFQEKEVLLREIHHRVKNNMQIISSLLSMQIRNSNDEEVQNLMKDLQMRIRSLGLVHELLYLSENLNNINYRVYLEKITGYYLQSYAIPGKQIRCILHVEDIGISIEKAVPLSLIISELLTNSFKYAFFGKEKGEITLYFRSSPPDNFYVLEYHDDGRGFDHKYHADMQGVGSSLIAGLTKQLSGTIRIADNIPGFHCTIIFPYEVYDGTGVKKI